MTSTDAEADDGAFSVGGLKLIERVEYKSRATGSDRMTEGDGAATGIDPGRIDFTERAFQTCAAGAGGIGEAFHHGEHLRGKGFVDLDDIGITEFPATAMQSGINRTHRAKSHAGWVATRRRITDETAQRLPIVCRSSFLSRHKQRHGSIGDLR